jgi:hypothetical protein
MLTALKRSALSVTLGNFVAATTVLVAGATGCEVCAVAAVAGAAAPRTASTVVLKYILISTNEMDPWTRIDIDCTSVVQRPVISHSILRGSIIIESIFIGERPAARASSPVHRTSLRPSVPATFQPGLPGHKETTYRDTGQPSSHGQSQPQPLRANMGCATGMLSNCLPAPSVSPVSAGLVVSILI